jgi:hypothetical protein
VDWRHRSLPDCGGLADYQACRRAAASNRVESTKKEGAYHHTV